MDQPSTKDPRGPVSLRIKFRSASLDQFIERYAADVSRGGIFIRTREPLAVGTQLRFDFQLQDAAPLISGEGTVVWIREHDPARAAVTPGMGVRFDKLTPASQPVLDKILAEKASREQGPTAAGVGKIGGAGMAVRRSSSSFSAVDPGVPAKGPTLGAAAGAPGATGLPARTATPSPPLRPSGGPGPGVGGPGPGAGFGSGHASGASIAPSRPPAGTRPAMPTATGPLPAMGAGPGAARAHTLAPPPPAAAAETPPPARPRLNTGAGGMRPAPAPPALFEPPTAEDIDRALEALTEMPGPAPMVGVPTGAIADYPSNEPTRIGGESFSELSARAQLGGGTSPIAPPLSEPAAPMLGEASIEEEAGDRTELSLGSGDVLAEISAPNDMSRPAMSAALADTLTPPPAAAMGETPPPLPGGPELSSGQPTMLGFSVVPELRGPPVKRAPESAPTFPLPVPESGPSASRAAPRSRAPVVLIAVVLAAAAFGGVFYAMRPKHDAGTETTATAPAPTAEPSAAAPPEPVPAPAPVPAPGAATPPTAEAPKPAETAKAEAPKAPEAPKVEAPKPEPAVPPAAAEAVAPAPKPGRKPGAGRLRAAARADAEKPPAAATEAKAPAAPAAEPEKEKAPVIVDDLTNRAPADKTGGAAAGQHFLKITSTPPGAEVLVDGTSVGKTPFLAGRDIDPGAPHAITLKKDGFENHDHMVSTSDWSRPNNGVRTLKLNVKMRKVPGAEPAKAEPAIEGGGAATEPATAAPKPKDEAPASP